MDGVTNNRRLLSSATLLRSSRPENSSALSLITTVRWQAAARWLLLFLRCSCFVVWLAALLPAATELLVLLISLCRPAVSRVCARQFFVFGMREINNIRQKFQREAAAPAASGNTARPEAAGALRGRGTAEEEGTQQPLLVRPPPPRCRPICRCFTPSALCITPAVPSSRLAAAGARQVRHTRALATGSSKRLLAPSALLFLFRMLQSNGTGVPSSEPQADDAVLFACGKGGVAAASSGEGGVLTGKGWHSENRVCCGAAPPSDPHHQRLVLPDVALGLELLGEPAAVELRLLEARHRVRVRPLDAGSAVVPWPGGRTEHRGALARLGEGGALLRPGRKQIASDSVANQAGGVADIHDRRQRRGVSSLCGAGHMIGASGERLVSHLAGPALARLHHAGALRAGAAAV